MHKDMQYCTEHFICFNGYLTLFYMTNSEAELCSIVNILHLYLFGSSQSHLNSFDYIRKNSFHMSHILNIFSITFFQLQM